MSEETLTILGVIAGAVLLPSGIVAWIILAGKKLNATLARRLGELTPSQTLAEAVLSPGATVELRARATRGAHKVWLECHVASASADGRWSATATLVQRISPPGMGYRDGAPDAGEMAETRLSFGEDGDGIGTIGAAPLKRTGALGMPRGDRYWLQLVALPACPEGSELLVRVGITNLTATRQADFRAFIGVSVA